MMYYLETKFDEQIAIPEHQIRRIILKDSAENENKFNKIKHIIETVDGKIFHCRYHTKKTIEVPLGHYLFVDNEFSHNDNDNEYYFYLYNVLALEYKLSNGYSCKEMNGTIIKYFIDEINLDVSTRNSNSGYLIDMHRKCFINNNCSENLLTKENLVNTFADVIATDTIINNLHHPLKRQSLVDRIVNDYCLDQHLSLEQILLNPFIKLHKKVQVKI